MVEPTPKMNMPYDAYGEAIDRDYLNAVYFPETSSAARIPTWFSGPSSTFTQRFHYYKNTGPLGNGLISFAPQDITGFPILQTLDNQDFTNVSSKTFCSTTTPQIQTLRFAGQNSSYIAKNYSAIRLVGAVIKITYIGSNELESGFMSGGHVYNTSPFQLSDESVEEGFFKVSNVHPHEGIRLVYYPKDSSDLDFFNPFALFTELNGSELAQKDIYSTNFYTGTDTANTESIAPNSAAFAISTLGTIAGQYGLTDNAMINDKSKAPSYYWGLQNNTEKSQHAQQLVTYWRGLPANQQWLRIDVERHFEGIPMPQLRDIVSLGQSSECEVALDFVQKQGKNGLMHGHTASHHKKMEQVVKPNIELLPVLSKLLKAEQKYNKPGLGQILQYLTGVAKKQISKKLNYDVSGIVDQGIESFKQMAKANDDIYQDDDPAGRIAHKAYPVVPQAYEPSSVPQMHAQGQYHQSAITAGSGAVGAVGAAGQYITPGAVPNFGVNNQTSLF